MLRWFLIGVVLGSLTFRAAAAEAGGPEHGEITWEIDCNTDKFFGHSVGDCAVALYGGPEPRRKWRLGRPDVVAGSFSRRLVIFWNALNIEPEVGFAQCFHGMQATEVWAALAFRWTCAPPSLDRYEFLVRLQHRSGIFGQINDAAANNSLLAGYERISAAIGPTAADRDR